MKKILLFVACMILLTAFIGCEDNNNNSSSNNTIPEEIKGGQTMVECSGDNECRTGGCSGTICESIHNEPIITTCEYRPEYDCYRMIECRCMDNKCRWDTTLEFETCMENYNATVTPTPVVKKK